MSQLVSNEVKELLNHALPANNRAQLGTKLNGIYYGSVTITASPLDVALTGVEVGDIVVVSLASNADALTDVQAICAADKITITATGVSSQDSVANYIVIKA